MITEEDCGVSALINCIWSSK